MKWYWWLVIVVAVALTVWFALDQIRAAGERGGASTDNGGLQPPEGGVFEQEEEIQTQVGPQ